VISIAADSGRSASSSVTGTVNASDAVATSAYPCPLVNAATGWPGRRDVTPAPTARTVPATSTPGMKGGFPSPSPWRFRTSV
jgi:hypothetical protein